MRHAVRFPTLLLACLLAGCADSPRLPESTSAGVCPQALESGIHLTASIAQVAVPDGLEAPSGPVPLIAGVGRRILLSLEVPEPAPRVRVLNSSLALFTYGGILAGWARVVQPAGASSRESLQASGGFLRIAPFLPRPALRTYSQTVDVLVVPGGEPVSGLALRPGPMWSDAGAPIAPRELKFVLEPIQHMAALTVVDATARFEFTAVRRAAPHERWECSVESQFQLVDHDAVLPKLWTLQHEERVGSHHATLALYRQSVGPLAALFLDPATAAGFASWLKETHALRVGEYAVGLTASEKPNGFQPAHEPGLSELVVKQWGSD